MVAAVSMCTSGLSEMGLAHRTTGPGQLAALQGHAWAVEPHGVNRNIGAEVFAFSLSDSAFLFCIFIWRVHVYVLKVS